jgi:Eukaryotic-type carbonic anhydrase
MSTVKQGCYHDCWVWVIRTGRNPLAVVQVGQMGWKGVCATGGAQSPVNIPISELLRRPSAESMVFDYSSLKDATVVNSGHGAQVGQASLQVCHRRNVYCRVTLEMGISTVHTTARPGPVLAARPKPLLTTHRWPLPAGERRPGQHHVG